MNVLQDVPHFKQLQENSCAAAVLAMIYNYFGIAGSEDEIWKRLKKRRPETENDYYIDVPTLSKDADVHGLCYLVGRSFWDFEDSFQPIEELLNAGIPVAVVQQGHPDPKFGHIRLVVGIEDNYVLVNDPEKSEGYTKLSKKEFYNAWEATGDEVTGGIFQAIFPAELSSKINTLKLDDLDTNCKLVKVIGSNDV